MKKKQYSIPKMISRVVKETVKFVAMKFVFQNIISIAAGVSFGLIIMANQYFYDSVIKAVDGESVSIILPALLLGAAAAGSEILMSLRFYSGNIVEKQMNLYRTIKMNNKAVRINAIEYENPKVHDMINKSREGMEKASDFQFIFTGIFTFHIPYFLFTAVYLYIINPYLLLAVVFIFVPVLMTQFIRTRMYRKLEDDIAPDRRKYEYYEKCMKDREYFKETRILGAFKFHKKIYTDTLSLLNKKQWKADKRTGFMELSMKLITLVGYYAVLIMMVVLLVQGEISVGIFAAVFASLSTLFFFMERLVCYDIGDISKNIGSVENYFKFMDLKEREGKIDKIDSFADIAVENVDFSYPESGVDSLSDINLNIKAGSTIAIVGANGAGKSTLMRLISGIYLPTRGCVRFGNTDIADVKPKALFENISAVFQKYQKYQLSLEDNIVISDSQKENTQKDIKMAAKKAGVETDNKTYPYGYETMLSREFDGVDLSGGQWQRVAIARGYYRNHDMIILDEPTAAIDPIEESRIYEHFAKISKGKTAFIVTHRLGSAKIADRIIVMKNGRVVQDGTHDTLMRRDGEYATMYKSQAKWYKQ